MNNTIHPTIGWFRNTNPDYQEAAKRILTAEAAAQYCAGDMDATDDAGHDAIAAEASNVAAERNEVA